MIDTCPTCGTDWTKVAQCGCDGVSETIKAADALAKAARGMEGVEIGTSHWWAVEKNFYVALAAYERVRGIQ